MKVPTFVKWAGGKTQLLKKYSSLYPKDFNKYFEPFLGSAAIFFYIKQKRNPKECFLSDTNPELVNVFKIVQSNPNRLLKLLKEHKEKDNNREYFNEQRIKFNEIDTGLEKAALFIYLNKTCFNGLYRVNSKGEFNVPFGKYKNPSIVQEDKVRKASELLQGCEIFKSKFQDAIKKAQEGDFVYFDPPYYPLSKTASFTAYQKDAFLEREQRQLAEVFKKLDNIGCKVMLSNSDVKFITDLYEGFDIQIVRARRMISCVGTGRGKINELVVRNY